MSGNSSSSSNTSLPSSSLYSYVTIYSLLQTCINSTAGAINITVFTITCFVFLVPLYIFVLYLGVQRWRQQRPGTTMSHSDFFTYNMVVIELMSVFGCTLICCSVYTNLSEMMMVGTYVFSNNISEQIFLHVLTCVERYLAVVHPVTYLSLRKAKGIRIRNISIGCTWLLCFVGTGLMNVVNVVYGSIMSFSFMGFMLTVISFCSLSVLCVLIRPGPGEGGGGKQRVDQSKLRAFYTIMAILGVLVFRFGCVLLISALITSSELEDIGKCGAWFSIFWSALPTSLVLPLLFLQKAGCKVCCERNNESGHE